MKSRKPKGEAVSRPEQNAFHKTTWAKVKVGDAVLMAWLQGKSDIVEATITELYTERSEFDGAVWVIASFDYAGDHYPQRSFGPRQVIYVRSKSW